jgi:hypothetical protein
VPTTHRKYSIFSQGSNMKGPRLMQMRNQRSQACLRRRNGGGPGGGARWLAGPNSTESNEVQAVRPSASLVSN